MTDKRKSGGSQCSPGLAGEQNPWSRREILRPVPLTGAGLAGCALFEPAAAAAIRPTRAASPAEAHIQSLMADPSVQWHLANPLGIQVDAGQDAWHAGHVNDILPFADGNGLLVGADTGGVWLITTADQAIPLSDAWDVPDVTCL